MSGAKDKFREKLDKQTHEKIHSIKISFLTIIQNNLQKLVALLIVCIVVFFTISVIALFFKIEVLWNSFVNLAIFFFGWLTRFVKIEE